MRLGVILAVVVTLLGFSFSVCPAPADGEDNSAAANEAFERGRSAYNSGNYKEALTAFNEAYKLKPAWKIYYNIGQSCASLKQWGAALDAFTRYLSLGLDEIPLDRREAVEEDIDSFQKLVGYLKVTAPDGAKIYVDELLQGTEPLTSILTVNAGMDLKIRAELVDGSKIERTAMVPNEQIMSIDLVTGDVSTPDRREKAGNTETKDTKGPKKHRGDQTSDKSFRALKLAGWISLGVGAAALVGGAVTGGLALSDNADLEKSCDNNVCYSADYDQLNRLNSLATSSTVLIAVGGVATAVGAGLLIFAKVKESKESKSPKITFIPGLNGFVIKGRF